MIECVGAPNVHHKDTTTVVCVEISLWSRIVPVKRSQETETDVDAQDNNLPEM